MKQILTICLLIFFASKVFAQVIYVSTTDDELFRLDINNCTYEFVVEVQAQVFDISFHPNGNLYGIRGNGNFYQIDTLTGSITFIHDFNGQNFNSLTIASDGLVYTTGGSGELWSYDISTDTEIYHGDFGYEATGDLTFFEGNLYAAISNDRIALIDIDNPSNSSVIIDENVPGNIFGIVSYAEGCNDVRSYALTNNNSQIYEIDFENNSLNYVCQLNIEAGGGASTFEFFASSPIVVQDSTAINPSCGLNDGSIQIDADGGIGQIVYSIDGVNFQTSGSFDNLSAGNYTIVINDSNGCDEIVDVNLTTVNSPVITNILPVNIVCGNANGSLTILANGGTGALQYSIDGTNFQASNFFDNLPIGNYTVTVIDEDNCNASGNVEIMSADAPMITDVAFVNTTCGNSNGSLTILANGGTGVLQYSIDGANFQVSNVFDNLPTGNYTVTVIDDNNCIATNSAEIISADAPMITDVAFVNATCDNANGSLTILADGGTGALEFSIDGTNFQTSNIFENLSVGDYPITVMDANGCSDDQLAEIQSIGNPIIMLVQQSLTTCNQSNGIVEIQGSEGIPPYEFSIDGINFQATGIFENLLAGDYVLFVQDAEGCIASLEVEVEAEEPPSIANIDITQTSCGEDNGTISITVMGGNNVQYSMDGLNFQSSSNFENLSAGNYEVVIQDANDCQATQMITIESSELPLAQTIEAMPTSCGEPNGSIIIESTGGSLEFSINRIDYQQETSFLNLTSGDYTISIRDDNNCITTNDISIASSSELIINSIESDASVCGESDGGLRIDATGGTGLIQTALNGSSFRPNVVYEGLSPGLYDIQMMDELNCLVDTSFIIPQEDCPVYIPNAFSPNGDGTNDLFKIYPHPDFTGEFKVFKIFDRWGATLFEAQNFNPAAIGWDGTHKGAPVGLGVYVYFVEYVSGNGNAQLLEGDITLLK